MGKGKYLMEKVTVEELRMILKYISKGYKVPDIVYNTILKVAKIEVEDAHHAVIIKRDPTLVESGHRVYM